MSKRSARAAKRVQPELISEQQRQFQAYTHGFGEQDANGVDLSLLRENLRLSPSQRVAKLLAGRALLRSTPVTGPEPTFRPILAAFNRKKVRYLLIGGVAMRCHGSAHLTDDVSLFYARDAENLAAPAAALAPFHPRLRGAPEDLPFRWDARTLKDSLNLTLVTDAGSVDLLGHVPGAESFDAVWERASEVELLGERIRVAALDDLIAMKKAAGRPKDQLHLMELEGLRALLAGDEHPEPKSPEDPNHE